MTTRELRPVDRQEFLEAIGPIQVRLGKLEAALAARSESEETQPKATPTQEDVDALVEAAGAVAHRADETLGFDEPEADAGALRFVSETLRAALIPFQKG